MRLFAISDLHLSSDPEKKMDHFGEQWINHASKIYDNWKRTVGEDDVVLISGDICWAKKLSEGVKELELISDLPGEKVFVKGNHDFWWESINKVRSQNLPRMHFIQNNAIVLGDFAITGTRLWDYEFVKWPCVFIGREDQIPAPKTINEEWLGKIRRRELNRLKSGLKALPDNKYKIAMVHYPPIDENGKKNHLTDLMTKYGVDLCVFGHIHAAQGSPIGADCTIGKTRYKLTTCDWLDFIPVNL